MASSDEPSQALDEIVWRSPPVAQEMQGIHSNSVLFYFARSPFFDHTSNNAVLASQAMYNMSLREVVATRVNFEARLRTMSGVEFMVVHDPSENDTKREHSGVWVIRKQSREGRRNQGLDDLVTSIAEYFVVGDSVYMAPTVGAIVESRMLSAASALTSLMAKASSLPLFNPSTGHTYLPVQPKTINPSTTDRGSTAGSVRASKENSPMPEGRGTSVGPEKPQVGGEDRRAAAMLAESLRMTLQYGDEYMDETPLIGEPGNFIIQKTKSTGTSFASALSSQPKILSVKTDITPVTESEVDVGKTAEGKKSAKLGDKSPLSPLSPMTPGGGKKRKKSRSAQGSLAGKLASQASQASQASS